MITALSKVTICPTASTDFDYLIIDTNGSRWRIGNNDDLAASGYLQYDADYDCIYAYNEHDGRRLSVLRRRQQREHLFGSARSPMK